MAQFEWSDRPDPDEMRASYDTMLALARQGGFREPEQGWKAEQVLAHVLATTELFTVVGEGVRRGEAPECGNPDVVDDELLARRAAELGGVAGLTDRLESAAAGLVTCAGSLTDDQATTKVRFIVHHDGSQIADEPRTFGSILSGHAGFHLPLHIKQLQALVPGE
jgi:hypothetical protein